MSQSNASQAPLPLPTFSHEHLPSPWDQWIDAVSCIGSVRIPAGDERYQVMDRLYDAYLEGATPIEAYRAVLMPLQTKADWPRLIATVIQFAAVTGALIVFIALVMGAL